MTGVRSGWTSTQRAEASQRGMTMIELMVSLAIGMVLSVALFSVLAVSEGRRRTTTGINDTEQAGQLAMYFLDQWVRSAGSGFASEASAAYGCSVHAKASSGTTLPHSGTFAAPFASVNPDGSGNFALAPLLILPNKTTPGVSGSTSDVLVVMGGAAGLGGAPLEMTVAPSGTTLTFNNTLGLSVDDLVLLLDPTSAATGNCYISQVGAIASSTTVTLGATSSGNWALTDGLSTLSKDAVALPLGTLSTNPPLFLLIGVGDNDTLYSYDLLQTSGSSDTALQARAQGVFEMHAVYGVDTDDDGKMDNWASPSSGDYAYSKLVASSSSSNKLLRRIKAIRVALVLRVPLKEKTALGPTSISWFNDLSAEGLDQSRTLTSAEQHYRYRVVEATLILRNNLMLGDD